jgi:hypothetical protein
MGGYILSNTSGKLPNNSQEEKCYLPQNVNNFSAGHIPSIRLFYWPFFQVPPGL